ncbi:MAG: DNA mismatch repair protein MutS [Lachnospiraceae bacterium]|nr:DNA mismatch repair protein MutS [Lachnospiraceae bacterium]
MMQQYLETKKQYPDCILFYRLGDFYEMFFDDALVVSKELELTLTGKSCGLEERAPMCGVPHHAADGYINRLVKNGHKVAIVEQMEDPALAKGLVKREVIRIVTPGTTIDAAALDETKNNYLMCIVSLDGGFGIATVDVSTGDFYVTDVDTLRLLSDEINKFTPSEIICNNALSISGLDLEDLKNRLGITVYLLDDWYFAFDLAERNLKEHFHVSMLAGLGLDIYPGGTVAAGALLQYLTEMQKNSLEQLTHITPYSTNRYMVLDTSTRRNLEITETLREKQKRGSLLWVLDKTKTAMGARMLRSWLEQPLLHKEDIKKRQDAIEDLNAHVITRDEMREYLNSVYDLERLISRIAYRNANPRDFIAFKNSVAMVPPIRTLLLEFDNAMFRELYDRMDELRDLKDLIEASIVDDPPIQIKEGDIIKDGYLEEIDELRRAKTEGKDWLAQLEAKEREATGIKNLKIKFNKVFGYYIEVTNSFRDLVPEHYIRKQTLTNAERYMTPELKELEDKILGAEDKLISLEYRVFQDIRDKVAAEIVRIQETAKAVAALDVFASLAYVAERNDYVRPKINENGILQIRNGRHPVVEKMMSGGMFVPNDTLLDNRDNRISVITGPNMAGKSTYMRQTALIVLMAQIGSFVPAEEANLGICDRIFTRVGASDDLASGQSTFMVEMTEVANILRNATKNSLLVLDEIGRGTSTFDGLSIAWAVIEHISDRKLLGAKTLFATHYHELTELEGKLDGVHNYCIAVKEHGDDIVFLRKIIRGGADKSYGIQVAKLAGIPDSVIQRAKELVEELSSQDIVQRAKELAAETGNSRGKRGRSAAGRATEETNIYQMSLFDADRVQETTEANDIVREIRGLDIGNMTPLQALNKLYELQNRLKVSGTAGAK